jgi:hypothetical protein
MALCVPSNKSEKHDYFWFYAKKSLLNSCINFFFSSQLISKKTTQNNLNLKIRIFENFWNNFYVKYIEEISETFFQLKEPKLNLICSLSLQNKDIILTTFEKLIINLKNKRTSF